MKKLSRPLLTLVMLVATACSAPEDSVKHLGQIPFDQKAWSQADQETRGKMAYDLLKKVQKEKLKPTQIRALLGEQTGYYNYDEIPAYLVGPKTVSSEYGDGYLIAFPYNSKTGEPLSPVVVP